MIGQHPQMYGLPEVNLFVADDIHGVFEHYVPKQPHGLHGLFRTIAQLEYGEQTPEAIDAAKQWLEQRRDWSTRQMFQYIQELVSPRICVDKSPVTVKDPRFMRRMLEQYPDASYLHLTRHPVPTCRSIHRLAKEIDKTKGSNQAAWLNPEKVWLRTNTHIAQFAEQMAPGQLMRIQGEMLLTKPELYFAQIADWLGLDSSPEAVEQMLHPECSPYACLGPDNAVYGNDPNFLKHPEFTRREIAESRLDEPQDWLAQPENSAFSRQTIKLARKFGYR